MSQSLGGFWGFNQAADPADLIHQGAKLTEILQHNLLRHDMNFGAPDVVGYFCQEDILYEMLNYVVAPTPLHEVAYACKPGDPVLPSHKIPYLCSEIISDGHARVLDTLVHSDVLMMKLFSILDVDMPIDPSSSSYFRKIVVAAIQHDQKTVADFCLIHDVFPKIIRHIGLYSCLEILIMIGWDSGTEEAAPSKDETPKVPSPPDTDWLADSDFIYLLVNSLSKGSSFGLSTSKNIACLLTDLLSKCSDSKLAAPLYTSPLCDILFECAFSQFPDFEDSDLQTISDGTVTRHEEDELSPFALQISSAALSVLTMLCQTELARQKTEKQVLFQETEKKLKLLGNASSDRRLEVWQAFNEKWTAIESSSQIILSLAENIPSLFRILTGTDIYYAEQCGLLPRSNSPSKMSSDSQSSLNRSSNVPFGERRTRALELVSILLSSENEVVSESFIGAHIERPPKSYLGSLNIHPHQVMIAADLPPTTCGAILSLLPIFSTNNQVHSFVETCIRNIFLASSPALIEFLLSKSGFMQWTEQLIQLNNVFILRGSSRLAFMGHLHRIISFIYKLTVLNAYADDLDHLNELFTNSLHQHPTIYTNKSLGNGLANSVVMTKSGEIFSQEYLQQCQSHSEELVRAREAREKKIETYNNLPIAISAKDTAENFYQMSDKNTSQYLIPKKTELSKLLQDQDTVDSATDSSGNGLLRSQSFSHATPVTLTDDVLSFPSANVSSSSLSSLPSDDSKSLSQPTLLTISSSGLEFVPPISETNEADEYNHRIMKRLVKDPATISTTAPAEISTQTSESSVGLAAFLDANADHDLPKPDAPPMEDDDGGCWSFDYGSSPGGIEDDNDMYIDEDDYDEFEEVESKIKTMTVKSNQSKSTSHSSIRYLTQSDSDDEVDGTSEDDSSQHHPKSEYSSEDGNSFAQFTDNDFDANFDQDMSFDSDLDLDFDLELDNADTSGDGETDVDFLSIVNSAIESVESYSESVLSRFKERKRVRDSETTLPSPQSFDDTTDDMTQRSSNSTPTPTSGPTARTSWPFNKHAGEDNVKNNNDLVWKNVDSARSYRHSFPSTLPVGHFDPTSPPPNTSDFSDWPFGQPSTSTSSSSVPLSARSSSIWPDDDDDDDDNDNDGSHEDEDEDDSTNEEDTEFLEPHALSEQVHNLEGISNTQQNKNLPHDEQNENENENEAPPVDDENEKTSSDLDDFDDFDEVIMLP